MKENNYTIIFLKDEPENVLLKIASDLSTNIMQAEEIERRKGITDAINDAFDIDAVDIKRAFSGEPGLVFLTIDIANLQNVVAFSRRDPRNPRLIPTSKLPFIINIKEKYEQSRY